MPALVMSFDVKELCEFLHMFNIESRRKPICNALYEELAKTSLKTLENCNKGIK